MTTGEKSIVITTEDLDMEQPQTPSVERIVIRANELSTDRAQPSYQPAKANRPVVSEFPIGSPGEWQAQNTNRVATMKYAGFWVRVGAALIDGVITLILSWIVGFGIGFIIGFTMGTGDNAMAIIIIQSTVAGIICTWLYFALLESSKKQATFGKRAFDLYVTDERGQRIGFGRATGRYFGKIISSVILCIGYIMVAFTARKQGLHDKMAGTLVLKR